MAISNSIEIRRAHNSFAKPEPLISDGPSTGGSSEDVYHFISYLPINGKLYELDGLKEGPICLADCTSENWLELVTPQIQKRIERYSQSEIRFNLLALIKKLKVTFTEQLNQLQIRKIQLDEQLVIFFTIFHFTTNFSIIL